MCCLDGNVIFIRMQRHIFLNIVIDTKSRDDPLSWGSPPPRLRAGVGLSHRTQLQRYKDGEGDPKDKGFRPGGRRSFDSWQVGVSIDSLL